MGSQDGLAREDQGCQAAQYIFDTLFLMSLFCLQLSSPQDLQAWREQELILRYMEPP